MAKLSEDEQRMLKQLSDKAKAPEGPAAGVTFSLDLSNDKAYERALKLGLVPGEDDPEPEPEDEPDEGPRRRGYFPEAS